MIQIEKTMHRINSISIKESDYFILQRTDVYFGPGIYEIKFRTEKRLCYCVERLDGSVNAVEISGVNSEIISASDFTQRVTRKVIGTIIVDLNASRQTINDLLEKLAE